MTYSRSNGVRLERRSFLELSALLAGAGRAAPFRASSSLAFPDFARTCEALAKEHLELGPELAEPLLLKLAEAGARLEVKSVPRPSLGAFGGYEPKVSFGPVHRAPPVALIEWRLEPDALLPAHNHTPGYVLSLCLEGECWLQHFEIAGDAPEPGEEGGFQIRKTRAQLLRPGQATSLTSARENIHTFRAGPRGALGIDVNVFLPGPGDWSMIEYEDGPRDGFEKLYDARWTGQPR